MKLENQVCSIEQGKRLKELGVTGSLFQYHSYLGGGWILEVVASGHIMFNNGVAEPIPSGRYIDTYPAYTVAELGAALPTGYGTQRLTDDVGEEFFRAYDDSGNEIMGCDYEFEAQSRAAMITRLLETGTLTASEVNERTNNA